MKIRSANPADAPEIARLMRAVWNNEQPDPAHIARVIERGNRTTLIAEENWNLLGFIDAFGTTYWELDLVAVAPTAQGRGIGKDLVHRALEAGRSQEYKQSRALVALTNNASQGVMRSMGMIPSGIAMLWVFSGRSRNGTFPFGEADVTPVHTMRYTGGWLNEPFTPAIFPNASALCVRYAWDVVGAVIPDFRVDALAAAENAGYEKIGDYRWWTKAL